MRPIHSRNLDYINNLWPRPVSYTQVNRDYAGCEEIVAESKHVVDRFSDMLS